MTPLVSIGIPSFNSAPWLKQAIESALGQTYPEKEVIVVDDGSTDESLLIASAFGDRILLRRSGHRGANHARNLVVEEARGEWLQFLDADDYLEPEKIARQWEEGEASGAEVLYSPVWIERTTPDGVQRERSELDPKRDLYSQWLTWELPQTGGCLWNKGALERIGRWREDQPCCQEHELYARALQAKLRFHYTPTPGAVYRIWSGQTLCRKDPRQVVQVKTKLIDQMRDWLMQSRLWTERHGALAARVCFEMARTLAKEDMSAAARYYRERRRRGLIRLEGPAAPRAYRMIHRVLGFRGAEALARRLR